MQHCEKCGVALTGNQKRFCSRSCRYASTWSEIVKECSVCGKEVVRKSCDFRKNKSGNVYCGIQCRQIARRYTAFKCTKEPTVNICPVCQKPFLTGGRDRPPRNQRFCSLDCQRLGRYRRGYRCNNLSVAEASYMAGIVDGEGSIILSRRRKVVILLVVISNTKRELLDWIAEKTGIGAVNNQYPTTEFRCASYAWRANAEAALTLLTHIKPYLVIKQRQAELAIDTQERLANPMFHADLTWQNDYITRMKELNKRGPAAM